MTGATNLNNLPVLWSSDMLLLSSVSSRIHEKSVATIHIHWTCATKQLRGCEGVHLTQTLLSKCTVRSGTAAVPVHNCDSPFLPTYLAGAALKQHLLRLCCCCRACTFIKEHLLRDERRHMRQSVLVAAATCALALFVVCAVVSQSSRSSNDIESLLSAAVNTRARLSSGEDHESSGDITSDEHVPVLLTSTPPKRTAQASLLRLESYPRLQQNLAGGWTIALQVLGLLWRLVSAASH